MNDKANKALLLLLPLSGNSGSSPRCVKLTMFSGGPWMGAQISADAARWSTWWVQSHLVLYSNRSGRSCCCRWGMGTECDVIVVIQIWLKWNAWIELFARVLDGLVWKLVYESLTGNSNLWGSFLFVEFLKEVQIGQKKLKIFARDRSSPSPNPVQEMLSNDWHHC